MFCAGIISDRQCRTLLPEDTRQRFISHDALPVIRLYKTEMMQCFQRKKQGSSGITIRADVFAFTAKSDLIYSILRSK